MRHLSKFWQQQIVRFMAMGSLSTTMMLLIYLILEQIIRYQVAYLISYAITIVISYFLNTRFVFRASISFRSFFQFPIVYIIQYGVSAILLEILVRLGLSATYAPILVIMMLLPLTYWLSQLVIVNKKRI